MKQTRTINLPIAGKLQHGLKLEGKGPKELGYFIAKTQNSDMNFLMNRFKERYPKDTKVNIRFFDENPLTIRNARYGNNKTLCYCLDGEINGKERTKKGWQPVECTENCPYRKAKEDGKPNCNREATLKFILPEVTTDRIFLMKIKGQTSIDRIKDYIALQRMQGKSILGDYILSLHQEEQINRNGKQFNNFILDIYKKEDFNSNNISPNNNTTEKEIVNKKRETTKQLDTKKNETKIVKQSKKTIDKRTSTKQKAKDSNVKKMTDEELQQCFTLISTKRENIKNNNQSKEYVIGNFVNIKDEELDIIIPPDYAEELESCDLGTTVKLDVSKSKNNRMYAKTLEYVVKLQKNNVAA